MRHRRALLVGLGLAANVLLLFVVTQRNSRKGHFDGASIQSLLQQSALFIIEPRLLTRQLSPDEVNQLRWRFDLPRFKFNRSSLTLGVLDQDERTVSGLTETGRVEGTVPFGNQAKLLHLFGRVNQVRVHIVVFHRVKNFFWIGQIPPPQLVHLSDYEVHFGKHEEIFDPFALRRIHSVLYPDEIAHFLSQIPTSRYLACPEERREWLTRNNVTIAEGKLTSSTEAIVGAKGLMKRLGMQFWMACGTLLGWHRQCHITPYTSDTDFATWAKYLDRGGLTDTFQRFGPEHSLRLYFRYGEPEHSMEYSFLSAKFNEKVDLFFIYPNGTHFLLPYHLPSIEQYAYSLYPTYELCSVELLGYKLLAPCTPEQVILTEYGSNWQESLPAWDYANSPQNSGPLIPFTANLSQEERFIY